jgi:hypothetical protein
MSICFIFQICQHQTQPLKISQVESFKKLLKKVTEIPQGLFLQLQTYADCLQSNRLAILM